MEFQKIIQIEEHPPRADKSAVCAINRHLLVCQVSIGALSRASAGTYPSHQRWFLSVLPTTLARLLLRSQAEREALRSYPTGETQGEGMHLHFRLSNQD